MVSWFSKIGFTENLGIPYIWLVHVQFACQMRNNSIEWKHRNIKLNIDLGKTLKLSCHFWLFVEWVCLFGLLYFSILISFCCCFVIFSFVFTFLECFSYFMRSPWKRYGQETEKKQIVKRQKQGIKSTKIGISCYKKPLCVQFNTI